jgi:fatty-acyl-CoA synthase
MHGGGHWCAFGAFLRGNRVVVQDCVHRLDAADVWRCVERERANAVMFIGDAFARPLLDELESGAYDVSSLGTVASGGAALNGRLKQRFVDVLPGIEIVETGGASETGGQLSSVSSAADGIAAGTFVASDATCVISEDKREILASGHPGIGWLAQRGRLPLGYLNDATKTAEAFPIVAGERMSVPGDRARQLESGLIELLGRESVTINSGGEKIFAEEVEQAFADHAAVLDVIVCGRPSKRWGQEVVALVQLRPGIDVTDAELMATAAGRLARYKLPKEILRRDTIVRSPTGKPDYCWAREQVEGALHA